MRNIKAIVFDMDDTLYPEVDYVLSGFRAVAKWFDTEFSIPFDRNYQTLESLFKSGIRGNTFNLWLDELGIEQDQDLIKKCIKIYREHQPSLSPYKDVIPTLQKLKPDYRIGLVSDGYLEVQQHKFRGLGLSDYFDATVFSDEFGREAWKPSTIPFQHIVERLEVSANQAIYLGDNPAKDFFGANQLGMNTIWIRRSRGEYVNSEFPSEAYEPQQTIDTLRKLKSILSKY